MDYGMLEYDTLHNTLHAPEHKKGLCTHLSLYMHQKLHCLLTHVHAMNTNIVSLALRQLGMDDHQQRLLYSIPQRQI